MNRIYEIIGRVLNDARGTASFNPTLTNFAQGVAAEVDTGDADFLAPEVQVPSTIGQYKSYSDKNTIQAYDTQRPLGGKAERIKFEATDPGYNCKPHALEVPVDDAERDAAPAAGQLLDESKVRALVNSTRLSRLVRVLTALRANKTAVPGYGNWYDPNVDPIDELDACIVRVAERTGMMPNRIWLDLSAWNLAKRNKNVKARISGAKVVGLSVVDFQGMLVNPGIQVKISTSIQDTTKLGQTASPAFVGGKDVFIFYALQSPDLYDPSFAKSFTGRRGGVSAVRTYRDDQARSDVHAVDWSEQIVVPTAISGERITVLAGPSPA